MKTKEQSFFEQLTTDILNNLDELEVRPLSDAELIGEVTILSEYHYVTSYHKILF